MDRIQYHNNFKKKASRLTKVISCVTASLLALSPAVYSQGDEESLQEEVIVFGIRQALTDALSMKRDAENIVDTVSAEDIGSLPDITIGESLARVSGVTVTSFRGRANEIAIRGLSPELTLITINGREQTSTNAQIRNPLLIAYPSELISRAQVYKTPLADVPEGGVAGTINMETVRPLEQDGRKVAGTFRAIRSKADELAGADGESFRGSIAYVDQFADDKFGIAVGLVGADVSSPSIQQSFVGGGPNQRGRFSDASLSSGDKGRAITGGDRYEQEVGTGDEDRVAGLVYLQYQPNDQWNFNLDVTHTRLDATIDQTNLRADATRRRARANSVIADDSGLVPGVDDGYPLYYVADNVLIDLLGRSELREDDVTYGGFNVAWEPTEAWHLEFDYALTESIRERKVINATARNNNQSRPVFEFDRRNSIIPVIGISEINLEDPTLFQPQLYREDYQDIVDKSEAFRLDAEYSFDSGSSGFNVSSVEVGYRFQERSKDRIFDNDVLPAASRNQIDFVEAALDPYWDENAFSKAFRGRDMPTRWMHIDLANVMDQVAEIRGVPTAAQQGRGFLNSRLGVISLGQNGGDIANSYFYSEDTSAFYFKANIEGELFGVPFTGGFGVRYVETDVTARSNQGPIAITSTELDEGVFTANLGHQQSAGPNIIESTYDNVLPALNLTFELRDDLLFRVGMGTVIARPNFGSVRPIRTLPNNVSIKDVASPGDPNTADGQITQEDIDAGGFDINGTSGVGARAELTVGNPLLEPFEANQLDVSLEWYFNDDAAVTGTLFYKDVVSYVDTRKVNDTTQVLPLSSDGTVLTIPVEFDLLEQNDSSGGSLSGIEIGYQQQFSHFPGFWSNLGFQGNYTFLQSDLTVVSGNISYFDDQDNLANQELARVPLNNYSRHLVNGQLYWEDDVYTIRLAYNFNSDEAETGRTNGTNERYADNASRWDLNLAYRYNDNWRFVLEVFNLLDEARLTKNAVLGDPDVTDGIYDVETRPFRQSYYGRTIYAGFNFNF